ncbi:putative surface protein with fasciclin (FAS1) repeats [Flavobacterium aquaticum]|uniref:Putative surface protein with fasciclin (FAS1) repeats n=1 Tax=Flavobacterium aquaticum TaxID=1236486 RepID=A0A327YUX3_9FLAO|nr:fasciclin domain-containing protein [Flavobacterium aquaticum]RAK25024.1 putative surface protein with fasciclin (FAS1) repeats [Flavobacterium aquaticum]
MKNYAKLIKLTLLVVSSTLMFSCSDDDSAPQNNSITDIASGNPNFSILVDALSRADLAETLDQAGSYTVFAPTNDAFLDFLDANGFESLDDVPLPTLTQVLLNHVVSGTNLSTGLTTGYVKTLAKGSASSTNTLSMFINTESGVRLNGVSSVTTADITANNGVIHVVDAVIGLPTIVTHATANPNFSTLASLLTQQELVGTLDGTASSPFTVFAPLNSAFDTATLNLYSGLTSTQKTAVLTYHVVAGANVLSNAIPSGPITTFETGTFTISGTVITDEQNRTTNIVATDVQASNGVIHAVNKVLLPNLD